MSADLSPSAPLSVPESGLSTGQPQEGAQSASRWVWGVDPSTKLVAIACVGPDGEHVESREFLKDRWHGARLADIRRVTRSLVALLAERCPPLYVFVEQPAAFGHPPEPQLMYAVGVIQEAVFSALEFRFPHPVEVRTVPIGQWKKAALGNGAAKKPEIMRWAERRGHFGLLQDEADALGIAVAGQRLLEPEPEQLGLL